MPLLWVILILEVSWTVRNTLVVFYTMFKRLSLKIRAYFLLPRDKLLDCLFRSPEPQWPQQPAAGWRAPCAMGGRCGAQGNEKKYENCYYLYLQWKYCMADNSIQSSLLFILHYIFWTKPMCRQLRLVLITKSLPEMKFLTQQSFSVAKSFIFFHIKHVWRTL